MFKERLLKDLPFIIFITIFYYVLYRLGIGCPIKFITGISCPGCGMTRAWISALHLDFKSAFYYHPLFFSVPFMLILFVCKEKVNNKILKIFFILIVLAYVTIYAIRLYEGGDIVVFKPYNNILFRLIRYLACKGANYVLYKMWCRN